TITLIDFATRPALRAGFVATRDLIACANWTRGTCPACGALPALAELRASKDKDGQTRILRCVRCTAAWSFARLACPACGERKHEQLRFLHVENELDHRRAECCRSCGFYVKAIARLDPADDTLLAALDLETLALDVLAVDAGYRREVTATK
ncbi:MAG TPA: formate dehydrogenase accessory protein FdhE, partial [Burkholderiales bacterium]|nr:formate dehydrogenase accessory protein FdhE [Burkholderiales bacterium]